MLTRDTFFFMSNLSFFYFVYWINAFLALYLIHDVYCMKYLATNVDSFNNFQENSFVDGFFENDYGTNCHIRYAPRIVGHACRCGDDCNCHVGNDHRCYCPLTATTSTPTTPSTTTVLPTIPSAMTANPTTATPVTQAATTAAPITPHLCSNNAIPLDGVTCFCSVESGACISTAFFDPRAQGLNAFLYPQINYSDSGYPSLSGSTNGVTCYNVTVSSEITVGGALCSLGCSCA